MIFYMDANQMEKYFLPFEDDKDILESWYVLVSNRIKKRSDDGFDDNIASARSILFPNPQIAKNHKKMGKEYYESIDTHAKVFLASMVRASIVNKVNIFFLCTKNEAKLGFFPIIASYLEEEFGYPMYSYLEFTADICKLKDYDEMKVLGKVDKIIENAKEKASIAKGEGKKYYKKKSKREIKKLAKELDVYFSGMDKKEMIEAILDEKGGVSGF